MVQCYRLFSIYIILSSTEQLNKLKMLLCHEFTRRLFYFIFAVEIVSGKKLLVIQDLS